MVCDIKPDIVCLAETWTNGEHLNALLSIPEFNIIARVDRKDTTAGKLNIIKPRANLEIRRNFFSLRVIDPWNNLPEEIKCADTLNRFKNLYDNFKNNVV